MPTIIEVQNLTKKFRSLTAVNQLSFSVNEGDIYGFLGQNGAGKSTTIRMMLTLVQPTSGHISIFGKNLADNRSAILKQVGAVIEKPDMYKYLSAYQNLALFAKMSGIRADKKVLMNQLEMVGLADRAHSKVKEFSQGMKQRLGIAVALVHDPKLIILDEPTNGLDPQGIADIRNLIMQLSKKQGKTILVSSHLLSEIEQIANRIIIIDKGKKIVEGESAVLLDPAKTLVQLQTADNQQALATINETKWKPFIEPVQPGHVIRLKMDKNEIPELNAQLVNSGIKVLSIQTKHSLEEYFLSLTTPNAHVEAFTD
jgi:ABC-type multidrug transport system ATPase subunit